MTLVVLTALAAALSLTPLAWKLAWRFGAVSQPDGERRLHESATALWGGSAVYLAVLAGVAASYRTVPGTVNTVMLLGVLGLSGGMLCLLGCIDDYCEMRARWKLLGQIISTLPVILVGCYVERVDVMGWTIDFGVLGALGTLAYFVIAINSLNLIDGMDGLASTIGIVICIGVALISTVHGNPEAVLLALALAGALVGFLVYNLPPARIYLGDCGSMVIGLAISVLVLDVSREVGSAGTIAMADVTIMVSLLFVPLLDTSLAILRRLLTGHGVMVADRGHLHHRLLDRGFSVWGTLLILAAMCATSGSAAWVAAAWGQTFGAWAILGALVVFSVNRRLAGHEEWQLVKAAVARRFGQPALARYDRTPPIPFVERPPLDAEVSGKKDKKAA